MPVAAANHKKALQGAFVILSPLFSLSLQKCLIQNIVYYLAHSLFVKLSAIFFFLRSWKLCSSNERDLISMTVSGCCTDDTV